MKRLRMSVAAAAAAILVGGFGMAPASAAPIAVPTMTAPAAGSTTAPYLLQVREWRGGHGHGGGRRHGGGGGGWSRHGGGGGNWSRHSGGGNWSRRGGHGWYGRRGHRGYWRDGYWVGLPFLAYGLGAYDYNDDYYDGYYDSYPYDSDAGYARCEARFRSFDPHTGTYMGYDGHRHRCPYL